MRVTEEWLAQYQARQQAAHARGNQLREIKTPEGETAYLEVPRPVPEPPPPARKTPQYGEDAKQKALIDWSQYVTVGPWHLSELLFAVPNGGYRTTYEAVNFKLLGVQAGIPDLCLPVPAGSWHGGYWEMKHGKNGLSDSQVTWHQRLRSLGYYVNTCWQWEEAARDIVRYLGLQSKYTIVERVPL